MQPGSSALDAASVIISLWAAFFFISSSTMKVVRCIAVFLFSKPKSAQLSSPLTPEHPMRTVKDLISLLAPVLLTSDNQIRSNTRGVCITSVIPHHCLSVQVWAEHSCLWFAYCESWLAVEPFISEEKNNLKMLGFYAREDQESTFQSWSLSLFPLLPLPLLFFSPSFTPFLSSTFSLSPLLSLIFSFWYSLLSFRLKY